VATLTSMTDLDIMENGELKNKEGHLEDKKKINGDLPYTAKWLRYLPHV
jgi:hypothetical protein